MKPEYARTTITVPWGLKKKMKQVGGRVNWSAVACDAFEEKLESLGPIEEITSIDDAVARMKSMADQQSGNRNEAEQNGMEAGKYWALNSANPDQLRLIEEFWGRVDADENRNWEVLMLKPNGRERLAVCIAQGYQGEGVDWGWGHGGRGGHRHRARGGHRHRGRHRRGGRGREEHRTPDHENKNESDREMAQKQRDRHARARMVWRSILSERPGHPAFFLGFANGALEVWGKIKGKLD